MELVEREAHRSALREYAAEARSGSGRMVLVSGEAGAGKTSLVEAVEHDLSGPPWAWGGCDALSTPRPFAPLLDLAPRLDAELDRLCRGGGSRDQIFDALIGALDAPEPPVVVVEDVQWADDATLDLLRFLGRRVRHLPALVVVTYRDDELESNRELRDVLGLLAGQRSTRRIEVPPLSERAVARLAEGTPVEAARLHRLTGGNPFFVAEVLRTTPEARSRLPVSVRDVVLGRAARLAAPARAALDAAALIGQRVPPALLDRVTGVDARAVDGMLSCGLVRSDGHGFVFRHELARLAVAEAVGPHHATAVHATVLAALREEGEGDDARLAFHAEAAGDGPATLHHALRAARDAVRLGSHREALAQYERALRHGRGLERREHGRLLDALATEAAHVDVGERALETRTAALTVWRKLGDSVREGASLSELVSVLQRIARGAEATEAAELAVAVLEPLGETDELARALSTLAANRMMNGRSEEAASLAERAVLLAERRSLPDVLSDAVNTRGCLTGTVGGDGFADLRRAVQVAQRHGLGPQAGRAYSNLHAMLVGDLRFAEAEQAFADGSEYCDRRDLAYWGWSLRRERFGALERTGRWDEALVLGEEVMGAQLSVWNRIRALEIAAVLRARRGEPGARELLDRTTSDITGIGEPQLLAPNAVARAELHWLAGDLEAAAAELAGAEPLARRLAPGEAGPLAVWTWRLRGTSLPGIVRPASPYRAETEGRVADAVREWDELGCPYDAALALAFSDAEADLREAVVRLDRLGATAAVAAVRRRMRRLGLRSVPAGSRASTRANRAGLTRREQEVLELVCEGLTNDGIAERLVLSTRTVDHHVSAVLRKLAVPSRQLAAEAATRSGLVPTHAEDRAAEE